MSNIKKVIANYSKEEKLAFINGAVYSNACELLKSNQLFEGYTIDELMLSLLNGRVTRIK